MSIIGSIFVRLGLKSEDFNKGLDQSENRLGKFGNVLNGIGAKIAGAFSVGALIKFTKEAYNTAAAAQGIYNAFAKLNQPGLLNELKEATRGTTDEVKLMQAAVQAKNFKIPLENLATYFKFATDRAIETGESVDYLVNSIVLGIGRKSPMILDNLGLNIVEIREEFNKTGDMAKSVANIIDREMSAAGDVVDTAAVKTQRLSSAWKDFLTTIGGTGAVQGTGNFITKSLTEWLQGWTSIIKSDDLSVVEKLLATQPLFTDSVLKGARLGEDRDREEEKKIVELVKAWMVGVDTLEQVDAQLMKLGATGSEISSQQKIAVYEALSGLKDIILEQERANNQRENSIQGIKEQIKELQELYDLETDPAKKAAYAVEISALEKRLELIKGIGNETKAIASEGSIDYLNDQIKLQNELFNAATTDEIRDRARALIEEYEARKALLNLSAEERARIEAVRNEHQSTAISTSGINLSSLSFDSIAPQAEPIKVKYSVAFEEDLESKKKRAESLLRIEDEVNAFADNIGLTMADAIQVFTSSLIEAGNVNMGAVVASLLTPLADLAIKEGAIIMASGEAIEELRASFIAFFGGNAIVAGAALIAIGAAAKAGLSALASSGGGSSSIGSYSGSSSFSGGGSLIRSSSLQEQTVQVEVTGKLSGQDIYLSGRNYENNKKR